MTTPVAPDRVPAWVLAALSVTVALAISMAVYHPFYFGDELFSFARGEANGRDFSATFAELNAYKPRVLMNGLWAAVVALELPRWWVMATNALALAACAYMVARIAIRHLGASSNAALALIALTLLSRFNVMLYFDYVSGTVEALSLLAFLVALGLLAPAAEGGRITPGRLAASVALLLACVMTHERYLAGIAGLLGGYAVARVATAPRSFGREHAAAIAVLIAVPVIAVVVLVKGLSGNSLTMGTSGQEVQVDGETLRIAATYGANVFLGTNYGPDWFVGRLNQASPLAGQVFGWSALVLAACWIVPWFLRRFRPDSLRAKSGYAIGLAGAMAGMIAIASLPGADRQEARWMFPVFALALLLTCALYRGAARNVILLVLAISNTGYLAFGQLESIASIRASRTAKALGSIAAQIDPAGDDGLILGASEPDTGWVLGGTGEVFCAVNLRARQCLFNREDYDQGKGRGFGYALVPQGEGRHGPVYALLTHAEAVGLVDTRAVPAGGRVLGTGGDWAGWTLAPVTRSTPAGLEITGVSENFLRLDAAALDRAFLVYRAESMSGAPVPMRLQVNWHGKDTGFITATLVVVQAVPGENDYATFLTPPPDADHAFVYATLHDGAVGSVRVRSVRVVRP